MEYIFFTPEVLSIQVIWLRDKLQYLESWSYHKKYVYMYYEVHKVFYHPLKNNIPHNNHSETQRRMH